MRVVQVGVRHHDGKLFATVTADIVSLAQTLLEEQRQAFDHPVAHGMAMAVVDALEVIDIEHGKAQRLAFAAGAEAAIFKQLQDMRVVIQAGQTVANHPRLEAARSCRAVAHGGDQVAWLDRLGQEVIAAFTHGVELLVQIVFGRQVDDRHADITVVVADHLGQLGTGAARHVHVEDDQVRLELREFGHGLDRVDQRAGDDSGTVKQAFGVSGLSAGVIDDQHFIGLVLRHTGEDFDFFQKARGVERAGEKLLTASAYSGQSGRGVSFVLAEKQQRQLLLQSVLHLCRQYQAFTGAAEVDVHHDRCRVALSHGGVERCNIVQRQGAQTEEFKLFGQPLCALMVLEHHVDWFAQGRQRGLVQVVTVAQAGA